MHALFCILYFFNAKYSFAVTFNEVGKRLCNSSEESDSSIEVLTGHQEEKYSLYLTFIIPNCFLVTGVKITNSTQVRDWSSMQKKKKNASTFVNYPEQKDPKMYKDIEVWNTKGSEN